ncbi:site-specific DNA-methyltransferase [Enterococcus pallens]|uniref:DNA methylase N-4/N-6 domain-containing protein n=1 Tax=Enterococcus pallens ATCC BAA-351 TaxID=1158607 RepID=R2QJ79_9ENTE|nr:site-specific DNA-methyltransferase [Enterococcus pallens]EOH95248.1 hypothetical protein UAU_01210 [Enterococcus pallens ATCC BAA-351]EOU21615.1 hypothetical protein I588_02462 [Enterococcus pallens ATCC BAA-351]OJG79769.1 hypothetical protein RV10_GL000557 [Enterococcus pallens]
MPKEMDGKTPDLRIESINKLKEIFPEIVIDEDKIDFDKLHTLLAEEVDDRPERYNFTWNGKNNAMRLANIPSMGTLRPAQEKSKNWDSTENLYIEGDNLEVLKLLQKSYAGKIKVIYIDPPYNTGNDFVYKDDFKDGVENYLTKTKQLNEEGYKLTTNSESNGRFHTDWLNMLYPRLKLARNLLTDDGVIFISIDDNELANLRKTCDEIFGENNFIGQITYMNNPKGRSQDMYMGTASEYILIFSKSKLLKGSLSIEKNQDRIENDYPEEDAYGNYRLIELRNTHREFGKHNRPNLFYPIYIDLDGNVTLESREKYKEIFPLWNDGYEGCWTWGKEKAQNEVEFLVAKNVNGIWKIYRKSYANKDNIIAKTQVKTFLNDKKYFTDKGQSIFNKLFDTKEKYFQAPKAVELINMGTNKDSVILDFFSGSATTAHATMELNSEDGGNRKFIMVQLPEKLDEKSEAYKDGYRTICDIGEERIHRAGDKIKNDLEEKYRNQGMLDGQVVNPESLDIGFKVFSLDKSNIRRWNSTNEGTSNEITLLENNFIEGRTDDVVVYEILLKQGIELTVPIEKETLSNCSIYTIAFGALYIVLGTDISRGIAQKIVSKNSSVSKNLASIVFLDNGFSNDAEKLNSFEILNEAGFQDENLFTV